MFLSFFGSYAVATQDGNSSKIEENLFFQFKIILMNNVFTCSKQYLMGPIFLILQNASAILKQQRQDQEVFAMQPLPNVIAKKASMGGPVMKVSIYSRIHSG